MDDKSFSARKPETPGVHNLAHITHNLLCLFDYISVKLNIKSHFLLLAPTGKMIFHATVELSLMKKNRWLRFLRSSSETLNVVNPHTQCSVAPDSAIPSAPKKKTSNSIQSTGIWLLPTPCASKTHRSSNDWKLSSCSLEEKRFKSMEQKKSQERSKESSTWLSVQCAWSKTLS